MLNFLRKLRRTEMKSTKYFKYAFGEIFLVVIGILIALSISNWNESLKTQRWEKQFLTDLQKELHSDFQQLQGIYMEQSTVTEILVELIDYIKGADKSDFPKIDSLYEQTQTPNSTFFPTTGVYNSGLSAGKIENISNDELKYAIMNLYNRFYKRLVYNGEFLDAVGYKLDWEEYKFYDVAKQKLKSWESVMDAEFLAQIIYRFETVDFYSNLSKENLDEIDRIIVLISNEIDD